MYILDKILNAKVFLLEVDESFITITEECDEWHDIKLDKDELAELIKELQSIHKKLK